jgi:four helix bundle protein
VKGKTASEAVKPKHYKDLLVWQKGMLLTERTYGLTRHFPSEERFGLVAQMRRAAVSVPSNIAEGQARQGTREFLVFLSHAAGSLAELETQLMLCERLGFATNGDIVPAVEAVHALQKMIGAMRQSLQKRL